MQRLGGYRQGLDTLGSDRPGCGVCAGLVVRQPVSGQSITSVRSGVTPSPLKMFIFVYPLFLYDVPICITWLLLWKHR